MLKYSLQHIWKLNFKFILGEHLQQCCLEILFLFSDRILCLTNAFHCANGGEESWLITFENFLNSQKKTIIQFLKSGISS